MSTKTFPSPANRPEALTQRFPTPSTSTTKPPSAPTPAPDAGLFRLPELPRVFRRQGHPQSFPPQDPRREGFGADCSSLAELRLCETVGLRGDRVMFTSNETPTPNSAPRATSAPSSISTTSRTSTPSSPPPARCPRRSASATTRPLKAGNAIIGHPEEAKYGLTRDQLFEAYAKARDLGVKTFGLHTMVVSNELDAQYLVETARMLFELVSKSRTASACAFPSSTPAAASAFRTAPSSRPWTMKPSPAARASSTTKSSCPPASTRSPTTWNAAAPSPALRLLVTRALRWKNTYRSYVGVDASMANLMRPGMYGAYHHITVLGKEPPATKTTTSSARCARTATSSPSAPTARNRHGRPARHPRRRRPRHAMGYNYNGRPAPPSCSCARRLRRPDPPRRNPRRPLSRRWT